MTFDKDNPFADLQAESEAELLKPAVKKPKVRGYKNSVQFRKSNDKTVAENRERSLAIDNQNAVVRLDMATGIAPIARPLKKGAKRGLIDYHQPWKGGVIRFIGAELDDTDLGILLAVILIAQQQSPDRKTGAEVDNLLPDFFEGATENLAHKKEVLVLKTNYSKIREVLGKTGDGGSNDRTIDESLLRLSTIVVHVRHGKQMHFTHLIQGGRSKDDSLIIALSYRLTAVLLGFEKTNYGAIDMPTFNSLSKGTAQILYVFLCSWFGAGIEQRTIGIDKLVEHVYAEQVEQMSDSQKKNRRFTVRRAIEEIASTTNGKWNFKTDSKNIVTVQRSYSEVTSTAKA